MRCALIPLVLLAIAAPAWARESLGVFGDWGAFRDPEAPRCYAIAAAETVRSRRDRDAYATIGTWPRRSVRAQVHFRMGRELAERPRVRLAIGGDRFDLSASGENAWGANAIQDSAIVRAMRSAARMSISATDARGNRFTDTYSLDGAATAIDAAAVGCSPRR